jgi:UDP-N-acetylmuramate dehydrogenase
MTPFPSVCTASGTGAPAVGIVTIETPELGDRSYVVHDGEAAVLCSDVAETAERLVSARVVDLKSGTESSRSTDELGLSYRRSGLGPADLVLEATFRLAQGDPAESARRIAEIVRWRRENQPGGQNAGSVFANPPDDSAGRLIDAAGLKGLRIGTACVSDKHANFIQADDGGSADDVRRLIDLVRKTVAERTGVELAVEVRLVGFAGAAS